MTAKRRDQVWEMMQSGIAPSKMAELLGVQRATVSEDIRAVQKRLLNLGLRIGDWVEIQGNASYAFMHHGKAGVLTQIKLSAAEVTVDLNPLGDQPREQDFNVYDTRKLNEMEVLAKVSA